jgi:choline dehydrogenase-like flavoprotein
VAIIDARQLEDGCTVETDVCIVGAGAAGITLAVELEETGARVCLLESGGLRPEPETQALSDLDCVGYPVRENFMARARYYGGTCNLWAGRAMRLDPLDFAARPWVANSGWPIGYDDVAAYYGRADRVLRLPPLGGLQNGLRPPMIEGVEADLFDGSELKPCVAMWATKPLRFGSAYRARFKRSNRVDVYLNATATEVVLDDSRRTVTEIRASSLTKKTMGVRARFFVLSAGGLENARLLLLSRRQHAAGIGNAFDQVGRYFMDHPRVVYGQVTLADGVRLSTLLGRVLRRGKLQLGIGLSEEIQRREGLLNSHIGFEPKLSKVAEQKYETSINFAKVVLRKGHAGKRFDFGSAGGAEMRDLIYLLTPKEVLPHSVYRLYSVVRRLIARPVKTLTVINYCEQAPHPASRAYLGTDKDELGLNKLVLDWKVGNDELRTAVRLQEVLGRRLRDSGIGSLDSSPAKLAELKFTDASHHTGTTRMSAVERNGVVDVDSRVYGTSNLFAAGSSVFTTSGSANPTLTIVALSIRLADHLKKLLQPANELGLEHVAVTSQPHLERRSEAQ